MLHLWGSVKPIDKVKLMMYNGSSRTYPIKIEVGDGTNYTQVWNGNTLLNEGMQTINITQATGKYVKISMTANNSNGNSWFSICETEIWGQSSLSTPTPTPTSTPTPEAVIYGDSTTWANWSWNTTVNFSNTSPVYAGSNSISVKYNSAWAGLSLYNGSGQSTSGYSKLRFYAHGGSSGTRQIWVYLHTASGETTKVNVDIPAGSWSLREINLSNFGNPASFTRITFADRQRVAQPIFYIDDIRLVP